MTEACRNFNVMAYKLNSQYAEAYKNRGFAYIRKVDNDESIKDYDKAIELNPQYASAYNDFVILIWGRRIFLLRWKQLIKL